jgi:glycosyltransferase involved in cell wall biosynthesis
VGLVADFVEEGWPSMDLAAELTRLAVERFGGDEFGATLLRPPLPRPARGLPWLGAGTRHNLDRYLGRYLAYPRWLRARRGGYALFHLVDQSYAHLVHALPAGRSVVTCHDLDAFRSLLGEDREARPWWFRATMRRVLSGLRGAAQVICDSTAVRDALLAEGVVGESRLSVVPLPVHPDFSPLSDPHADAGLDTLLGPRAEGGLELLHVGANMPRKDIPLLLRVVAALRERHPGLRLLRVGGGLDEGQRELADQLGIAGAIHELPFLPRPLLAALYRRARVLLLPSRREGFGWPVLEAMACGTPVAASDLPSLREIAGAGACFIAGSDPLEWAAAVEELLREDPAGPRAAAAREAAARHSLEAYARGVLAVYRRVGGEGGR